MTAYPQRVGISVRELIAEAKRRAYRRRGRLTVGAVVLLALVLWVALGSGSASTVPSYPRAGVVPPGVREIDVVSAFPHARPVTSLRVTQPASVGAVARLIDALKVEHGPAYGGICPGIGGPTVTLALRGTGGTLLASASVISGYGIFRLSGGCNPVEFESRNPQEPGVRISQVGSQQLTATTRGQARFVEQLQRIVGAPLCGRSVVTPTGSC